jgi:hypothetical protein
MDLDDEEEEQKEKEKEKEGGKEKSEHKKSQKSPDVVKIQKEKVLGSNFGGKQFFVPSLFSLAQVASRTKRVQDKSQVPKTKNGDPCELGRSALC